MGKLVLSQIPAFLDVEPTHAPRTLARGLVLRWPLVFSPRDTPQRHRKAVCAVQLPVSRGVPGVAPAASPSSSAGPLTGTRLGRERCGPGGAGRGLCVLSRRGDGVLPRFLGGNTSRLSRSPGILAIVSFVLYISGFWKLNGSFLLHLPLEHLSFKLSGVQVSLKRLCHSLLIFTLEKPKSSKI